MPVIESTILGKILDWTAVAVTGGLLFVVRKLFKHDSVLNTHETAIAICVVNEENNDRRRQEDNERRDQQRKEVLRSISDHHTSIVSRIDALSLKIDKLHTKN